MNVKIIHNASEVIGAAIIIDVFRAFTVEPYIMNNRATKIIPVGEKEIAYQLKENNPNYILIGERNGIKLPGFDFGNSPTSIKDVDFSNKTVVHTTSCGTQGIISAVKSHAQEIFTGSLVNAKATIEYVKQKNYTDVSIVSMARPGEEPFDEDELCAKYLKCLLKNENVDFINDEITKLKETTGRKFFDKSMQEIFPEDDFYLCTDLNRFDFVLKVIKESNGQLYVEKIEIK